MWRLRSTRSEDAKSLRSDIVLKVFRAGDLKRPAVEEPRPAATLFFATLVFSGEDNFLSLLFFVLKIVDFGVSAAGGGVKGGVSRSSAAEDRRVRPLFFTIFAFAQSRSLGVRLKIVIAMESGVSC